MFLVLLVGLEELLANFIHSLLEIGLGLFDRLHDDIVRRDEPIQLILLQCVQKPTTAFLKLGPRIIDDLLDHLLFFVHLLYSFLIRLNCFIRDHPDYFYWIVGEGGHSILHCIPTTVKLGASVG